jgi:hypothetical protein
MSILYINKSDKQLLIKTIINIIYKKNCYSKGLIRFNKKYPKIYQILKTINLPICLTNIIYGYINEFSVLKYEIKINVNNLYDSYINYIIFKDNICTYKLFFHKFDSETVKYSLSGIHLSACVISNISYNDDLISFFNAYMNYHYGKDEYIYCNIPKYHMNKKYYKIDNVYLDSSKNYGRKIINHKLTKNTIVKLKILINIATNVIDKCLNNSKYYSLLNMFVYSKTYEEMIECL